MNLGGKDTNIQSTAFRLQHLSHFPVPLYSPSQELSKLSLCFLTSHSFLNL